MVFVQGPVAQDIEHLGIHHSGDKIEGWVAVGYHRKKGDFFIPQLIQFHFVILHHVPDSLNVKGGQPCAAGDQDAFQGLARNELSRTFYQKNKQQYYLLHYACCVCHLAV